MAEETTVVLGVGLAVERGVVLRAAVAVVVMMVAAVTEGGWVAVG